ncbi:MAG TPA: hypothetical protein VJZ03_09320 [Candidatus Bathyarchaeia archaeon]|nr:hypothetical protein [Candidatus Bathyarchaeia archaeon]
MAAKQRRKPHRRMAQCGDLQIEIRSSGAMSSMYMFSAKGKTLAQANLQNDSVNKLMRLPAEFSSFLEEDKPTNSNRLGMTSEISTLRYGLRGVSFKARIVQKSTVRAVTSKDGTPLLVCDVTLSDGTGEIPLAVWNNQIGTVATGDLIQVENARVRSFRGRIQLFLDRKTGVLTVLEHPRLLPS